MDWNRVFVTLGLAFGIFAADAYLNADTISIDLHVAQAVADRGFPEPVVEALFLDEIETVLEQDTVMGKPAIRATEADSAVSVLARKLGLDTATYLVQKIGDIEPVRLFGALVQSEGINRFVINLGRHRADYGNFYLQMAAAPGERMEDFVQRSAFAAMLTLEPYFAALYVMELLADGRLDRYAPAVGGTDIVAVERLLSEQTSRIAARRPSDPVLQAEMDNLLGNLRFLQDDLEGAIERYAEATRLFPTFAVAYVNVAFTRNAQGRYDNAAQLLKKLLTHWPDGYPRELYALVYTIWGTAEWGRGNLDLAEENLARAVFVNPGSVDGNQYWGWFLEAQGRTEEAQQRFEAARRNAEQFDDFPELIAHRYWIHVGDPPQLEPRPRVR